MKLKGYELLLEMNRGYDQVIRSLKALAKYPALQPEQIRRFEQLALEVRAATNTHLLDALSVKESSEADQRFVQRRRREKKDDRTWSPKREFVWASSKN